MVFDATVRSPAAAPSSLDDARARDLRRMKVRATALLGAAAVVYVLAVLAQRDGAATWVGFVRAAAEAGMVGGLADWFAVTALFRHPLGLPIPHTALIPTRKAALGESLADFVGTHFLAPDVVRDRLARADVPRRVGEWLVDPAHAERVSAEVAAAVRAGVGVLRDEDVRAALEGAVVGRLSATPVSPALGRLLGQVVGDRAHHGLVDVAVRELRAWWVANEAPVVAAVTSQAPLWSPRFLDDRVAAKVHSEVLRVLGAVEADPEHPFRHSIDAFLARLADDLGRDPATMRRVEQVKESLLHREDVLQGFGDLLAAGRRLLLEIADDPASELRQHLARAVADLGRRLGTDAPLAARVDGWLTGAAVYVVSTYRSDLTALITETVARWDGADTSRRVELHVGRDLQYIRINGTVVGALAGIAIHAVSLLLR